MVVDNLWSNATEITFAILFVTLLFKFIKQNEDTIANKSTRLKEKNAVIANQQEFIARQTIMMQTISDTVKETSDTMRKLSAEIHDINMKLKE